MMPVRKTTLSMLLMAAVAAISVSVSACSGGGDDDDDDDDGGTPNPYDFCIANWDNVYEAGPPTFFHRYGLFAMTPDWTTGTLNFGNGSDDPIAFILYQVESGVGSANFAITTSGSASITAPTNSIGDSVSIDIGTAPSGWFVIETDGLAAQTFTGGSGDLSDGTFNEYEECFEEQDGDCPEGTGTISFMVNSTNLTVGTGTGDFGIAFVYCNDSSAFAGMTREQIIRKVLSERPVR